MKVTFILFNILIISLSGCAGDLLNQGNGPVNEGGFPTPTLASLFQPSKETRASELQADANTPTPMLTSTPETPTPEPFDLVVNVNVNRDVHPISPLIYGVSGAPVEILNDLRPTLNSWGGNPSTRYNWKLGNAWNAGRDWFYRNGNYGNPEGSASDNFIKEAEAAGAEVRLAYPALGWVAKDANNDTCSFRLADGSCGDANGASCLEPGLIANPNTANVSSDAASIAEWMKHLFEEQNFKIRYLAFDNEPELWGYTHYDVHPACTTYEEILSKYLEYTEAIHSVAPDANFAGPVTCCWDYYWNSMAGDEDKAKHDNQDFLPWFLDSVRKHDEEQGWRSLHALDIHYYPEGVYNDKVDDNTAALRLRSTGSLWDSTYVDESRIAQPINLIPRMQQLIEDHYPGTQLGISEWNWGADNTMNGALAIADVLGIFGKVELDYAAYWTYPTQDGPGYNAFKLYTNYDGNGSRFGDTSVWADSSDREMVSSYAAIDSATGNLHLIIINKSPSDQLTARVNLDGYSPQPNAKLYGLDNAAQDHILEDALEDISSSFNIPLPPYSITLLVLQPQTP